MIDGMGFFSENKLENEEERFELLYLDVLSSHSLMSLTPFGTSLVLCATLALAIRWAVYHVSIRPNTLRNLAGPPVQTLFGNHMSFVLECVLAFQCLLPCAHHCSLVRLGPPRYMLNMSRNTVGMCV